MAWNYTTFKEKLETWLINDDVTSVLDDFILLAEGRLSRKLATRMQTATIEDTATSEVIQLPSDFIQPVIFYLPTVPKQVLTYVPPELLRAAEGDYSDEDTPLFYTIEGDEIIVLPAAISAGTDYVLKYYKTLTSIITSSTNWLLAGHPDVYLYACLVEAAAYLLDDARMSGWESILGVRIAEVNGLTPRARKSNSAVQQRAGNGAMVI